MHQGGTRMNHSAFNALIVVTAMVCPLSAGAAPQISVLSNRADLISGGDALVEIKWDALADANAARIDVDGIDVKRAFATRANGRYMGLVTGLRNGENLLTVRLG